MMTLRIGPATLFSLAAVLAVHNVAAAAQPNILLVIADDMTYHDCGAYGSDVVKTPNIDRLAAEGMRFERMFTSTAMCAPSRQQLYTGVWPVRNGAYPNHSQVYEGAKSWVHHFRAMGYRCGLAGKNHCKPAASFPWEDVGEASEWTFAAIREFIHRDRSQPWFLVAAHRDPHGPWDHGDAAAYPPEKLIIPPYLADTPATREALSHYFAEISFMDSQLEDVLAMVDGSGQRENTIVIFTSEQGASFAFGGKWTCYENGLRTSFIVRWPARVEAATTTDALCQYVDVLPTLVDAAGGDPTSIDTGLPGGLDGATNYGRGFDGVSFLPVLLGRSDRHRDSTYGVHTTRGINNGTDYPIRSVRGERFKYIRNLNHEETFTNAVTKAGRDRLEVRMFASWRASGGVAAKRADQYQRRPAEELYDLDADPFELDNLAGQAEYATVQQQLSRQLDEWMDQQGDEGMATELQAHERQGNRRHRTDE